MDIKSLPWYGQLALFVAIGLLFLGIFYKLYYAPGLDEIKGLQERKQTLEGEVKRLEQMKREVGRIENDIASKTENLEKLKEILPNRKEIAQILQTIQERAKDCNLEVRTFVPKGEVPKGITISQKVVTKEGDREKTEVKNVTVNDVYAEWPIDISVSGRYHNLAIFYVHLCS
ncbi:MAG TPA: type 4a pilus biogenesis protein PilO, partial [Candidatus Aminicenantes bacterium]|nr:type 4a pilus biogenesis protein PilO [Candidatus Aminicenantes bacterium]